jgi:hypothetical protein
MAKGSNFKTLLLIGVLVLGIYILPSAVAKYSGTWEVNNTAGVAGLQCGKCHGYIKDEFAFAVADNVVEAHKNASNNSLFVGPGAIINISGTPDGTDDDVCLMCHQQQQDAAVTGGHTKVVIRVCTDEDCHGDENGDGMCTVYPTGFGGANTSCNVTGRINESVDAHWNFYRPLTEIDSSIGQEEGNYNYNMSFVSCLACHTHVGLDINITRPTKFSLSLNLTDPVLGFNVTDLEVNMSNTTSTTGGKEPGSVWS